MEEKVKATAEAVTAKAAELPADEKNILLAYGEGFAAAAALYRGKQKTAQESA